MLSSAEDRREAIRPQFNRTILVDFRGQPHTRRGLSAARHWSATPCRAELSWVKKNDLGIHSEMISDGAMNLVEAGVMTCKRKTLRPRKAVITFAMATRQFYQWLDDNAMMESYPVDFTNDPFVIAENDNVVSINSAISVDLQGQVAADTLGPKPFNGVGGQVDFVRGANRSKGGRSIIAMPSTAAKGKASRIVAALDRGQAITNSRNDVAYIVTEHGIASLKGKTIRQRAEALIAIADPQFRDQLREDFSDL